MTLSPGTKLSHYEIISQIGKGGMGEVYQAKDTKLGRDVAIKVLPREFAKDTDRVARFQREAKMLASLNHANIAAIHGLEESDGTHFLVMELIEGGTLADRIKAGTIPVEESLKLALQIAEALEAAHEKGVIHRDLKPANIKVTPEDKVKVLDFGLAKAFAGEQADLNLSNSPTLSDAATQQGVILGTAAYMSPEQARGKEVDKRADVWAFGVVLFEMLTGKQVFTGDTVSDTLASVLAREPEWKNLPANLHMRIRLLLERCLKKEPKNRYHDIADARVDIQEVLTDPDKIIVNPVAKIKTQLQSKQILLWVSITVILLIISIIAVWKLRPVKQGEVVKLEYNLPEDHKVADHPGSIHAVSPDGEAFVYCTNEGLYLRSMAERNAKLIPGTKGLNVEPFFSPNGNWIGYYSYDDQKLKKVRVTGCTPFPLYNAPLSIGGGADWCADDTIIYGDSVGKIMRISADGEEPECIFGMEESDYLTFPQMLPGGEFLLCTAKTDGADPKVMLYSLKSKEPKELLIGSNARYLPTGHIIYVVGNELFAIPFDLDKLEKTGESFSVVKDILVVDITPRYDVSDSGTLVYIPTPLNQMIMPVWVDKKGNEEPIDIVPRDYLFPNISPDGTKVSFTNAEGYRNWTIWIWDLIQNPRQLTFETNETLSLWSQDSNKIVYSDLGGIYRKAADGRGEVETLIPFPDNTGRIHPWSWSNDGKTLVLGDDTGTGDIRILSMEGNREIKPLLNNEKYAERRPQVSPDGRWIAYDSNEQGRSEIYVRPFPDVNDGFWPVSSQGGHNPLWSQDGSELFYRNGYAVMAVSVKSTKSDTAFIFEEPRILFHKDFAIGPTSAGTFWDIHPDGKFLMLKQSPVSSFNIVLNFFEELKKLALTE